MLRACFCTLHRKGKLKHILHAFLDQGLKVTEGSQPELSGWQYHQGNRGDRLCDPLSYNGVLVQAAAVHRQLLILALQPLAAAHLRPSSRLDCTQN